MTAQLSREIVENLLQHNDESDSPANAEAWEVNALCRLALAGMDSDKNARIAESLESLIWPNMAIGNKVIIKAAIDALRAAPPAPVAVPDEIEPTSGSSDFEDYYCDGWNACRAAMLKGDKS